MKNEEKKPTAKEQETPTEGEGQIVCSSCQSRRIQVCYVKYRENMTVLTMLCMTCGNLFPLDICGVILPGETTISPTKPSPGYTG